MGVFVEQTHRGIRSYAEDKSVQSDTSNLTQKSLIARRVVNSISGRLWLDKNANGFIDSAENGVAGYTVSLYKTDDMREIIRETITQEDGIYRFENMEPGNYVVGIASETVDETKYLLPVTEKGNNKLKQVETNEKIKAYSETIEITDDFGTTAINVDAGLGLSIYVNGDFINQPLGGNILADEDRSKLVVLEADGNPYGGYYEAYTANESGLRQALFDIYKRNEQAADYIIYFGSDINDLPEDIFNDTSGANGAGDVSFASLRGRLNILASTPNL